MCNCIEYFDPRCADVLPCIVTPGPDSKRPVIIGSNAQADYTTCQAPSSPKTLRPGNGMGASALSTETC